MSALLGRAAMCNARERRTELLVLNRISLDLMNFGFERRGVSFSVAISGQAAGETVMTLRLFSAITLLALSGCMEADHPDLAKYEYMYSDGAFVSPYKTFSAGRTARVGNVTMTRPGAHLIAHSFAAVSSTFDTFSALRRSQQRGSLACLCTARVRAFVQSRDKAPI
jgi:hypothetical protein